MVLSFYECRSRLKKLADSEGHDTIQDFLEANVIDSVSPGICNNCDYTTEVEPDQREGYCEACGTQTVQSGLVLAGLI